MAATHLGTPEATDRWVQLAMVAYAQLELARTLTGDLRRPWHRKPTPGEELTPYRTRPGFRQLRARLGSPAGRACRPGRFGVDFRADRPPPEVGPVGPGCRRGHDDGRCAGI